VTFATGKIPLQTYGARAPENVTLYMVYTCSGDWQSGKHCAKFGCLPLSDVAAANEAKTRKPLKFAGVPQTNELISAASGPKFSIL